MSRLMFDRWQIQNLLPGVSVRLAGALLMQLMQLELVIYSLHGLC